MRKSPIHPRTIFALMLALLPVLLLAPASASATTMVVAKRAPNATLNKEILTNTKGRTLYSLSVEKHGKFICTGSCTSTWHPLVVRKGVKPKGPVKLGTVMRPDGRTQVTFRGRPLYTFSGDARKGQVNGEGIKDVGTWHAASIGPLPQPESQPPQPQPQPKPENPYGY
jgi:predicted lipoprotein with Yx(FWY)xxD motif